MAKSNPTTSEVLIEIPKIDLGHLELRIVGDSPYICHAWSDKAKKMLLDKQMKKAKTAKEARDPWRDFVDSLYWLSPKPEAPTDADVRAAKFGIPSVQFKSAAVAACRFVDGVKMTISRGAFHVENEFVPIIADPPRMREDMVRIGMGIADMRFRGEFYPWEAVFTVSYNAAVLSREQIVNLFNVAGFGVGIGEWRPSNDGSMGRFHVG